MPQIDSRQMPEEHRKLAKSGAIPADARIAELRPMQQSGNPLAGSLPEHLSGLIHDARNMVSALELYCDLLEEPGVLSAPYCHYAGELRRVGSANRRLLEGLSQLDLQVDSLAESLPESRTFPSPTGRAYSAAASTARLRSRWQRERQPSLSTVPARPEASAGQEPASLARNGSRLALSTGQRVENLAEELHANRNLLAAMAGHSVTLGMTIRGGAYPVAMSCDDLTRVLVNLVRNAAEAMPGGGHLQISLQEGPEYLTLSFTDNGPGVPKDALESIFSPGYSTQIGFVLERDAEVNAWPRQHRGLGLSIVRSLVASAGGAVWAANRMADTSSDPAELSSIHGAVILIEFPVPK
jgi:signal transduction histidine kinase